MEEFYPTSGICVNTQAYSSGINPVYSPLNLRVHRVPDLPAPLPEGNVRRFTREFYCRVILSLAAKYGQAWGRTAKWLTAAEKKFKRICERTFLSYIAELLAAGWIEYQIDDRGILYVNPLYCPPAIDERRSAGPETPAEWARPSVAAKVFASRIAEQTSPVLTDASLYSSGEYLKKEKQLTKTETVPVPASVGCSLASQKEKKDGEIRDVAQLPCVCDEDSTQAGLSADSVAVVKTPSTSASKPRPSNAVAQSSAVVCPVPLDLPPAAAQLVEEGKVKAKIVLSHIRRAGREIVDIACCAIIEHSQKKAIQSYEKALWSAVHDEWEPSEGFILPYRRGVVSADYVKPAPDAPASCWPGAKPDAIHRREYSRNHETGKDEPVSGKCRGLITRMVNWTYRSSRGMSDNEWFDVARSVVRSGSYLHLPMDWEAPRVEGLK